MFAKKILVASFALTVVSVVQAQDFFDFGQIPGVPDKATVEVDLNPTLIGLASQTTRAENPAVADLLAGIDGVRVRVYKSLENVSDVADFIAEVSNRLERADWQQVVSVQEDRTVKVYLRGDDDTVTGLTAMVLGDAEAVFITVAGTLNAELLAQTMSTLGGGEMLASLGQLNFGN